MEYLIWTALGLVIPAVTVMFVGLFRERSKLVQVGALGCAVAAAMGAIDGHYSGHTVTSVVEVALMVLNLSIFFFERAVERKKKAAA